MAESHEAAWAREKRELEERIKLLEAMQQQQRPQPAPAAPQPPAAGPELARVPSAEEIQAMVKRLSTLIPESSDGANANLFKHVTAITKNLLRPPYTEPKFRKLRTTNPTIAGELLAHPSARPLLQEVLGFEDDAATASTADPCLIVPASSAAHITTLRTVQSALPEVEKRDDVAQEAAKRFEAFRKSMAFEIRMEKLRAVIAGGASSSASAAAATVSNKGDSVNDDVRGFVITALLWNDADIGLKTVNLLRTIGGNVSSDPANVKMRSLRLSSSIVRDTLLPSNGTVEFLLAVLGFDWARDGLHLAIDPEDAECVRRFEARWQAAQLILTEAERGLTEKRQAENEIRRQAALAERDSEKRRIAGEAAAARRKEEERRRAMATAAAPDDDDGEDSPKTAGQGGERIPIAEALKRLMGRRDDDE
jgi:hypothetical protein